MKIYFGVSIRGGRDHVAVYEQIQQLLSSHGTVLTEHMSDPSLTAQGEITRTDKDIFERDVSWIDEADVLVMEVTNPSLGVGWETAYGQLSGKKVLCLFNETLAEKRLSAMIAGNQNILIVRYRTIEEVANFFAHHFNV